MRGCLFVAGRADDFASFSAVAHSGHVGVYLLIIRYNSGHYNEVRITARGPHILFGEQQFRPNSMRLKYLSFGECQEL